MTVFYLLQAGVTSQEMSNATAEYGLHARIGHGSSVGLAGFTLGGDEIQFGCKHALSA